MHLSKTPAPTDVTEIGNGNGLRDEHSTKEFIPIEVKEERILNVICINDEHLLKNPYPIIVPKEGIIICSNDEHPLKASFPISITEKGIVICANDEYSEKA